MKPKANPFLVFRLATIATMAVISSNVGAAERIKQNNTTALNLAGSWDVLPNSADIAVWNNTVTAANSTALGGNLTWGGIKILNPGGLVTVGTAATNTLTLEASGIDMSSATQNLAIISNLTASASQTWQVAGGRTLQIQNINTNTRLSGSGNITLSNSSGTGVALFDFRPGSSGSTGFTDQFGFYSYTGNWTVNSGVVARTLRNGRNAWGTGTITLNGGTIGLQQNFNGTWTNGIVLQDASNSTIDDFNTSGTRSLKLQGVISGSGNLTIAETNPAVSYAVNGGVVLTAANTLSGQVTVGPNAVLRVGGVSGDNASLEAGAAGGLGTATVVNNGTITLSRNDSWTFANQISSGTGALTVGGVSGTLVSLAGTQVVTVSGTHAYTGATTVGQGRLNLTGTLTSNVSVQGGARISGTGSTTGSLTMAASSGFSLNGGTTLNGLVANGVTISGATTVSFANNPTPATTYDVVTYGATGLTGFTNLTAAWRGSLTNDTVNQKVTFTTGSSAVRTWTQTAGTWDNTGANLFWAEGDQKFYDGDDAVFGDIASSSTITLSGVISPASVTVQNNANSYTFSGGSLAGNATLTKSNAGTLILTTANTFSGATTVSGGVLDIGNGGATGSLGSGAVTVSTGAELIFNRSNAFTVSNTISGAGLVTKKGAGLMSVTGNNSAGVVNWNFSGAGNGAIAFLNGNAMGAPGSSITLQSGATGSAYFGGTGNVANADMNLGSGSAFTWNGTTGNTNTIAGVISGSGSFSKVSGENLILTGNNSFTGSIAISGGGTLQIGGSGVIGGGNYGGNVTTANPFSINTTSHQIITGVISGSGRLEKANTGVLTLAGNNTYTGGTELLGGTLEIDTISRLGTRTAALDATGYLAIKQGGILRYTSATSESTARRLFMDNGGATIDVVNADTTLTWDDDGNVAKTGDFTKAGAGGLVLADPLTGASQTITVNNGNLTLTGVNTNGGGVFINAGKLHVSNTGRLGTGAIVNNSQLEFTYGGGTNVVLSQVISGSGSIVKNGAGSLSLTGFVSTTGPISAQGGTLRLQNELAAPVTIGLGATLATGTNAAIGFAAAGVTGSLTLSDGSASIFRIDSGTNHDRFYIDQENQFTVSGLHMITPVLVGTPVADEAFPIFDYVGTLQGNFSDFQLQPGTRFELVHNLENTSIDLVYKGGELLWSGGTGDWDIDLTPNWTLAGNSTNFFAADRARFDDTASTGAVNLVGTISPFTTTFQNETLAYTLSGSALSGTGSVVKAGAGTTTFLMASTYSGTTTVNGGKLRIGDGGALGDIGTGAVTIASGAALEFNRSNAVPDAVDIDYKTNAKLRRVSGAGDFILTGGAILFNYPSTGLGFAEANSWNQFSGNLRVKGGSEFRTIRNGSTAMGTGTIVLGDSTSHGVLSQIEGSWTWTNPIVLEGANNAIVNRSGLIAGGRSHKLQGVISGNGGLRLRDATPSMTDANRGYVFTAANTLTGTLTIESGVPLRIGGVPGEADVSQLAADAFGSLGSATVVNDGTLTFSRTDAHAVRNAISGTGSVRIGIPAAANLGNTSTQVLTYSGQATYSGTTTVNNGTLLLAPSSSISGSSLSVASTGTLAGAGTVSAPAQIAGTLAPGTGVATLTLGNTTLSGTYVCDVDGTQSDRLIAGDLNLTGSTLQIAGTATAGTYTIASYSGTLTGSFSGTLPDGYTLSTATPGEIRLVKVGTDFDNWISGFFPNETNVAIIGLNADPDGDGIPNGIEFVLKNGNPAQGNGTTLPTATLSGDTLLFTFERDDRAKGANAGMTLTVEAGDTLQAWPKSYTIGLTSQSPVSISNDTDAGPDTVTVAIPLNGATSQYARLKVTEIPEN
ncbi:MAG: beta strand repeat-containing protein [Akkermansiaceae bacterium]